MRLRNFITLAVRSTPIATNRSLSIRPDSILQIRTRQKDYERPDIAGPDEIIRGRGDLKNSLQRPDLTQVAREMPLFSVIIPSFNRVALLGATLESIFAQRFTNFEIIVVDDGSADGTMDYLQSFGTRISVLQQPNRGAGAARNLGARHAQGRYLAFLDSDDLWFPWTLEVCRNVIQDNRDPSFVVGKPCQFSNERELDRIVFSAIKTERFVDYLASGDEWRWWGASSFLVRRDAFI